MRLCKRTKTKNPKAEAPVNNKNFFSNPVTFSFRVKIINTRPNKQKKANGNKNKREPLNMSLIAGIKNSPSIKAKTPTWAQNTAGSNLFIVN